jgi:lipopolysaccharide transport protein LptA
VANGKPAAFQKHIAKTGKLAQGHADTIDYDVTKGIVRLTKNGWLTDGSYEERADSLKYNMITQTMNAEGSPSGTPGPSAAPGSDQDSQRVHITVRRPSTKP